MLELDKSATSRAGDFRTFVHWWEKKVHLEDLKDKPKCRCAAAQAVQTFYHARAEQVFSTCDVKDKMSAVLLAQLLPRRGKVWEVQGEKEMVIPLYKAPSLDGLIWQSKQDHHRDNKNMLAGVRILCGRKPKSSQGQLQLPIAEDAVGIVVPGKVNWTRYIMLTGGGTLCVAFIAKPAVFIEGVNRVVDFVSDASAKRAAEATGQLLGSAGNLAKNAFCAPFVFYLSANSTVKICSVTAMLTALGGRQIQKLLSHHLAPPQISQWKLRPEAASTFQDSSLVDLYQKEEQATLARRKDDKLKAGLTVVGQTFSVIRGELGPDALLKL